MIGLFRCQTTMDTTQMEYLSRQGSNRWCKIAYESDCDPADLFYKYYPMEGCEPPDHYGIRRDWEGQLDKRAKELVK